MTNAMRALIFLLAALAMIPTSAAQPQPSDDAAVRRLLAGTFEKPDAPLSVDPVVVYGDAAIAGWIQGELAGRAFLRRKDGQWAIIACGGDAMKSMPVLRSLGMRREDAERLAAVLDRTEAALDPARIARLSSFNGIVDMDHASAHANPRSRH